MSVLLDALKSAALEKQKREQEYADEHDAIDTGNNISAGDGIAEDLDLTSIDIDEDESYTEQEHILPVSKIEIPEDSVEIPIDIDFDELETQLEETISSITQENLSENEDEEKNKSGDSVLKTAEPENLPIEDDVTAEKIQTESENTSNESVRARSMEEGDTAAWPENRDQESQQNEVDERSIGKSDPVEKQRASFQALLETNKKITRVRKIKFFTFYFTVMFFLAVAIFAYYSYVMSSQSTFIVTNPVPSTEIPFIAQDLANDATSTDNASTEEETPGLNSEPVPKSISEPIPETKHDDLSKKPSAEKDPSTRPIVKRPRVSDKRAKQAVTDNTNSQADATANNHIIGPGKAQADPLETAINNAYNAFMRGDYIVAKEQYNKAWQLDPDSRDVILGRAAVALELNQYEEAMTLYQKQLEFDPQDNFAHAGLLAIASIGAINPDIVSRVNSLLKEYPDAAHLHFLKGALLAREYRWAAAQAAFFNAWTRDPGKVEYAYNLAISLDHIGQAKEALRFYKKSMTLAASAENNRTIDSESVSNRIRQLESSLE